MIDAYKRQTAQMCASLGMGGVESMRKVCGGQANKKRELCTGTDEDRRTSRLHAHERTTSKDQRKLVYINSQEQSSVNERRSRGGGIEKQREKCVISPEVRRKTGQLRGDGVARRQRRGWGLERCRCSLLQCGGMQSSPGTSTEWTCSSVHTSISR